MNVIQDGSGSDADPQIEQQYAEVFSSKPRSVKVQRKFETSTKAAAEIALGVRFDELNDARTLLIHGMCAMFSGFVRPETAALMAEQSKEIYDATVLMTMRNASGEALRSARKFDGVSPGEAVKQASALVLQAETLARIRVLDSGFSATVGEIRRVKTPERWERFKKYTGFIAAYPVRPTHVLLQNYPGQDNPDNQILYADAAYESYLDQFDITVDQAKLAGKPPVFRDITQQAYAVTVETNLLFESAAVHEALLQSQRYT